jgi:outer membrane protein
MLVSKTRKESNHLRHTVLSIPVLVLAAAGGVYAQGGAPSKIGIINMRGAISMTKDGQKAAADLNSKFAPTRTRLEKKQAEIEADKAKLNQGANAMAADQKEKLMRDIDAKTKALNRDAEDAQAEVDQETGKIMQELGGRMYAVLQKYGKDKGYTLILDVSSEQTPVLYAPDDLTEEIVKLYDQNSPAPTSAAPPAAAPKPTAGTPAAAPRPTATTPSPVKKAPAPKQ